MRSTSLSLRRLAAEPLGDLGSATPPDESYPPLNRLGLIADRRTAALIGPDGSLRWLCLPNYDGTAVFGALLDAERGGYWQLGPLGRSDGGQRYLDNSNVLVTTWADADAEIELIDAMPWPADDRAPEKERRRVVLRHLRCRRGTAACAMHLQPRDADGQGPSVTAVTGGLEFKIAGCALGLWTSRPAIPVTGGASAEFTLEEGGSSGPCWAWARTLPPGAPRRPKSPGRKRCGTGATGAASITMTAIAGRRSSARPW
jgi:hypothetical protein